MSAMRLIDLVPDAELLPALEPDELGLRILKVLSGWMDGRERRLRTFLDAAKADYPARTHARIEMPIREAWTWLEGQALLLESPQYVPPHAIRVLSPRANRLIANEELVRAGRRLPKQELHHAIREDVWALYHRGRYDLAVFEAMKAVEVAVRTAAGLPAKEVGVNLMRKAFQPDGGPLADITVEHAEREARQALFGGAIGSYKNPHSHRNVDLDDPDEAAEIIMLACHLLRIVDTRREAMPVQEMRRADNAS